MRIGDLAAKSSVSTKTIRYYEDLGLLAEPEREPNGYRTYSDGAASRLEFIRDAQASGLSLAEIGSILDMREEGESTCEHVTTLLETHISDLDDRIRHLSEMRAQLAGLTIRARRLDPADCTDPDRCQTIARHS